jgi:hypothetical protein
VSAAVWVGLAGLVVGCSDKGGSGVENNITALQPGIVVNPAEVIFGDIVYLYEDSTTVQILNAGRAPLDVSAITLSDDGGGVFSLTATPGIIEASEEIGVGIGFTPSNYLDYTGTLLIESNDPESPLIEVPLSGSGVDGPVPDIEVDLTAIDFGIVGEPTTLWFTLSNEGDGELVIDSVTQTGSAAFVSPNLPGAGDSIAPGAETTVLVTYTPDAEGDNGSILIHSNDPDEADTEVLLIGNGGGDFEYPVAVIDCPESVDPPTSVVLDGTASYDPDGGIITDYEWSIISTPSGSTGEILDPFTSYTALDTDLAGNWTVGLTVTNEKGVVSVPAECTFNAIPEAAIHVELTWDIGDSDLDLHLVQYGADLFDSPEDCCWCNRQPEWGDPGTADDPELALDDRYGRGPEDTRIHTPYTGDYETWVHYFADLGGGTATATLKIWIDGVNVDTTSATLKAGEAWNAGYIAWPEGTYVKEDNEPSKYTGGSNCD